MNVYLSTHPQVLSLLQDVKQHPEEDGPRLVLADWLEDNGDPDRALFLRAQCRLAPGSAPLSQRSRSELEEGCEQALDRHGGGWVGPLWRCGCGPFLWHRGLLATKLPRKVGAERLASVLPWLDTALAEAWGAASLEQALALLGAARVNHARLVLRRPLSESTLLRCLARLPESCCLRSLSIEWPSRQLRREGGEPHPAVSNSFLADLLSLPLGRHLSHLGSNHPFSPQQQGALASAPRPLLVAARHWLWMHQLPPSAFAPRSRQGEGKAR